MTEQTPNKADLLLPLTMAAMSNSYDNEETTDEDGFPDDSPQKKSNPTKKQERVENNQNDTPVLDKFGNDITKAAEEGNLDPVVGRATEIERVIQILSRRKKNNPVLIGEPGVGKSAIVEGLAIRIKEHKVSRLLFDKRIISLDMAAVVAGTKFRGQFEERIKAIIDEAKKNPNVILFIDEIHNIVGAGNSQGTMDAANLLKPALARGEIQCIGATTLDEYRKNIEKDGALERRFQKIIVEQTSAEETLQILHNIKNNYEEHHNVTYTDRALEACVKLTQRYVSDRFFPDKAIDALDEAGSRVHVGNVNAPKEIEEIEEKIAATNELKLKAAQAQNFEEAASLRDSVRNLQAELDNKKEEWEADLRNHREVVDEDKIAEVVAMMTGVPVQRIAQTESSRLLNMGDELKSSIVGQDEAIDKIVKAIQRNRVGLKDPNRPIGTFMFLGPTGVGKTHLAKKLSEFLFDSKDSLVRIDMSEYMEKYSVSRLIGAPPGYVGYEEGGQLSEKVRRKPYSVLLFDEIEKAHPDVFNMLLQVLEDGHITDAHGKKVDFKNTIIIMTSNAGANRIISPKTLGFGQAKTSEEEYQKMKEGVMEEVKHIFKPEFINRVDEMIVFHALNKENIKDITKIMLKQFAKRVKNQMDMELCIADDVVDFISDKGFDKDYGARPIRRALQTELEDVLAEAVLMGDISIGDMVDVSLSCEGTKKKIVVKKKTFADEKK